MLVTGDDIIYAAFTFGTNLRDRQALDFTGRDFRPETYLPLPRKSRRTRYLPRRFHASGSYAKPRQKNPALIGPRLAGYAVINCTRWRKQCEPTHGRDQRDWRQLVESFRKPNHQYARARDQRQTCEGFSIHLMDCAVDQGRSGYQNR